MLLSVGSSGLLLFLLFFSSSSSVSNSYATGAVTGAFYVGGLIGASDASVSNSYATGAVTGTGTGTGGGGNDIGGLIGNLLGSVNNSYTTGAVTGSGFLGGLIGKSSAGSSVTGKNYFMDASGTNGIGSGNACSSTDCVSQTAAQIAALTSTSSGWTVSTSGTTGNWNFGTTTEFPAVLYSGTSCETIILPLTNNINSNDGDVNIPDCGDIIKGQR